MACVTHTHRQINKMLHVRFNRYFLSNYSVQSELRDAVTGRPHSHSDLEGIPIL